MKKGAIILILLVDLMCVAALYSRVKDSSMLIKCFNDTGAEFQRCDVEGKSEMKTVETPKAVAKRLFTNLGMTKAEDIPIIKEDGEMIILSFKKDNFNVEIKTRKMMSKNSIYASVKLSQFTPGMNITNIRRSISKSFSYYKAKPSFSSLVQGKFRGILSIGQMKEKVASIYKRRFASNLEGIENTNMISYSGYINGIRDKVSYMGKWVNLNTALRYSKADGCTYIWIGSPIILLEY